MQKHRSWQGASEAEWQEACRREAAIRSLIESGPVSHARADVVAKDQSWRTLPDSGCEGPWFFVALPVTWSLPLMRPLASQYETLP
jgi:hypothetical protein